MTMSRYETLYKILLIKINLYQKTFLYNHAGIYKIIYPELSSHLHGWSEMNNIITFKLYSSFGSIYTSNEMNLLIYTCTHTR